ncbi:MAG: MATE family efflux transporter [Lachnospiraceae bacterium]|nr:MATE family efflux transporter [Lachnospiraceae bacterium]
MKSGMNLLEGNVYKAVLFFSVPIFFGNILQQLYNISDTAIIGNMLGDWALATVGAASPFFGLAVSFAVGSTSGFAVTLAQKKGANRKAEVESAVAWSYVWTAAIAIVITFIGTPLISPILRLLNTPEAIVGGASKYLAIVMVFSVVMMFYNLFASMLRAFGDSRTPLIFLMIASIINIVLDIVFIRFLGIEGAAIATVVAQAASAFACLVLIQKKYPELKFKAEVLKVNPKLGKDILKMGISIGMMSVIISIGTVALQSAVNFLGQETIAAHVAARKILEVFMSPIGTFSTAAPTIVGQSLGAGKIDRMRDGIRACLIYSLLLSVVGIILIYLFGEGFVKLVSGTESREILESAKMYLRVGCIFFPALCILVVVRSSLQGMGRNLFPNISSAIELIMKFFSVRFITERLGYFGVCIIEPIIWIICALVVWYDYIKVSRKGLSGVFLS